MGYIRIYIIYISFVLRFVEYHYITLHYITGRFVTNEQPVKCMCNTYNQTRNRSGYSGTPYTLTLFCLKSLKKWIIIIQV